MRQQARELQLPGAMEKPIYENRSYFLYLGFIFHSSEVSKCDLSMWIRNIHH